MSSLHLVLGTGPLGLATATALLTRGKEVRLVNRSGRADALPDGATIAAADLSDTAAIRAAGKGAQVILFCAQPPYHLWPQQFPALQDHAIGLAEHLGARLIVAENLYGYGPVDRPMTEDMPLAASTKKGRVRARMHDTLMQAHSDGRIDATVARGSDFFGPGVVQSALDARVFEAVSRGRAVQVLGNLDLPHSYTYVPDFGTAMAILGTDARGSGQVWHVPNAPAIPPRALIARAAALAGTSPRVMAIAPWQLRLMALAMPPLRELVELTYQATAPFIVDHTKFAATFGDISTPLDRALSGTLAAARAAPPLRAAA